MSEKQPQTTPQAEGAAKGPSKKDLKKAEKKAAQAKAKEEREKAAAANKPVEEDSSPNCGDRPLIQSSERVDRKYVEVGELDAGKEGQEVLVRARVHTSRAKGNLCFLVLRHRYHTVQAVLAKDEYVNKFMLKFAAGIPRESIIEVNGVVRKAEVPSTTQSGLELAVRRLFVISRSLPNLPIMLEDASRPQAVLEQQEKEVAAIDEQIKTLLSSGDPSVPETVAEVEKLQKKKSEAQKYVILSQEARLDNRVLDLRTSANQAIFTIQSAVGTLFREFLLRHNFVEIHTPKLIAGASEGGASVFKVSYFDTSAFLAQSPQLSKQMAVCADLERVFEVAPVFRAENSQTHRHMTEFMGLDMEMAFKDHYYEALDLISEMFTYIFDGIAERFSKELETISQQYPFQPLKYNKPTFKIPFAEGIKMLREAGIAAEDLEDLSTPQEKALGALVKEKYGVDFYVLDKFPKDARPFYTMPDPADERYTNSYDFFIRCEEICSGAQRIHDPQMLEANCRAKGVDPRSIQHYIDAFKYGAPPHAGCGVGLERIVMLYLGLNNIRKASMFPRDPRRLAP
jgi:aspartyl-tRNA synthetase